MALNNDQRERLSAYLDDEVTPRERAEVESWLASDPAARSELETLRRVSRAVAGLTRAVAGPGLADRVISQVEREALLAKHDAPHSVPGRSWLIGLGAAAVLVMAVTIALRSRARVAELARVDQVLTVADAEDSQPVATAARELMSPSESEESDEIDQLRARFNSGSQPSDLATAARPNAVSMAPAPGPVPKTEPSAGGPTDGDDSSLSYAYLPQRELGEAAKQRSSHGDESVPAIRAMARAEDRDEVLYRLYQFVEASPSAEFVEAEISEMALLIPGLDWLFLGLPVGGEAGGSDEIEITLDEADVPELLAVLQPIAGTRYELRASELAEAPVAAGRVATRRDQVPQRSGDRPAAGLGGAPAETAPAAAESRKSARALHAASQSAAGGNLFDASRRIRVVVAFQSAVEESHSASGSLPTTQPAGARP